MSTQQQVDLASFDIVGGYAMLWWIGSFDVGGEWVDTYYAVGDGGQYIIVIPSLNTVVILTGQNYSFREYYEQYSEHPFIMMLEYILPAIVGT